MQEKSLVDRLKEELAHARHTKANLDAELQEMMRILGPARATAKRLKEDIIRHCIRTKAVGYKSFKLNQRKYAISRWRAPKAGELVDYDYWCRYNYVNHSEELRMERILKIEAKFEASKIERLKKQIKQEEKKKKKGGNDEQYSLF